MCSEKIETKAKSKKLKLKKNKGSVACQTKKRQNIPILDLLTIYVENILDPQFKI